jgi:membrane protein DedA with SNARE-associated domain
MSDWIIGFITDNGYLGIFLMMLAENVFPPIPSELIMPFAGFAAARGDLSLIGVLVYLYRFVTWKRPANN